MEIDNFSRLLIFPWWSYGRIFIFFKGSYWPAPMVEARSIEFTSDYNSLPSRINKNPLNFHINIPGRFKMGNSYERVARSYIGCVLWAAPLIGKCRNNIFAFKQAALVFLCPVRIKQRVSCAIIARHICISNEKKMMIVRCFCKYVSLYLNFLEDGHLRASVR